MNTLNKWKHWPAFWQLVREHDICPESDKERLGECEIELWKYDSYDSNNFNELCNWGSSGFAGEIMAKLSDKIAGIGSLDLDLYTYINSSPVTIVSPVYAPPKTVPLPSKVCHRCGMEHDEMHPTEACKRLLDAEEQIIELKEENARLFNSKILDYNESFISGIESAELVLSRQNVLIELLRSFYWEGVRADIRETHGGDQVAHSLIKALQKRGLTPPTEEPHA